MAKKGLFILILVFLFLQTFIPAYTGSGLKNATLILESPGQGSRVTSPINLSAQIEYDEPALIKVTLTDRSGVTIARKLLQSDKYEALTSDFNSELAFEIPRDTSEGLLSIALLDSYNRPITLRSTSLTLINAGEDQILTPGQQAEWLKISQPETGDSLSGGSFRVRGTVTPLVEGLVFFELITDSGGQIGTRQLSVDTAGEPVEFDIDIPYAYINQKRDVRLIVRQRDTKFGSTIILDSVPIFLSP